MIVYRDVARLANARAFLDECVAGLRAIADGRASDHAQATRLLIDFGELETAVTDALFPSADGVSPVADGWRRAAVALGHLFVASWLRCGSRALRGRAREVLTRIEALRPSLPRGAVRLRVPEGYAYYALYPETYVAAAEQFNRGRCPGTAVCLGLRSIGTSLSAAVAARLEAAGWRVLALTLRPRGHPFLRRPVLTHKLSTLIGNLEQAYCLIVDEGPGLSGSSFCGTAAVLSELGVPSARIVLFPSWPADGSTLNSEAARDRWCWHPRVCCSFEDARRTRRGLGANLQDLSGGAWRRYCYPDESCHPAVQPQHERRKYLATSAAGRQVLLKFAGLGRYGSAAYARAEHLAEAGFTPPVLGLHDGFLLQTFVAGRPLCRADADASLLRRAAEYLTHLRHRFVCDQRIPLEPLLEMIEVNVVEGLGTGWRHRLGDLGRFRRMLARVPAVAVDGRMMPHEWLRTPGLLKTDAVDHHADHFFPGPQDIAWDVAGFGAEFGLGEGATRDFADELATLSGDRTLIARLPFYRVAYLAHRLGYASLAARTLGPLPDGARMAMLAHRYGRQLRRAIAGLGEPCAKRARTRRNPGGLEVVVAPDGRATPR